MKKAGTKWLALLLTLAMLLSLSVSALAAGESRLQTAVTETGSFMYNTVKKPEVGSIGGEWAIIGLARSGVEVPEKYYQDYYSTVEKYVKDCGGVLHDKKYTEYSRVTLALSAIGMDARDVGGYDLTKAIGDYDKTIWQGINGPIWALIALDSKDYPMPQNPEAKTQATRQMYVDRILACQLDDGGWNLLDEGGSGAADPDITGMALQALAKYTSQEKVKTATEKAVDCLGKMQNDEGGYSSWGTANSESVAQVIVALCELGVKLDDSRFVKNGHSLVDNLLTFRNSDGSFNHVLGGETGNNQMSSEQGFYALVAALRAEQGKNSLYRMSDSITVSKPESSGSTEGGLPGKHADVKVVPVTKEGVTFEDIKASANKDAIEALASRGIIDGMTDTTYVPANSMTRAQFAAIVVRALGFDTTAGAAAGKSFADVKTDAWYHDYVITAAGYGIVDGVAEGRFDPEGTINRQQAATMVARAAKLCGMDTELSDAEVRDMLAQFGDYVTSADWARPHLAFCYKAGILSQDDLDIQPTAAILRGEMAQMIFNMLGKAELI